MIRRSLNTIIRSAVLPEILESCIVLTHGLAGPSRKSNNNDHQRSFPRAFPLNSTLIQQCPASGQWENASALCNSSLKSRYTLAHVQISHYKSVSINREQRRFPIDKPRLRVTRSNFADKREHTRRRAVLYIYISLSSRSK